MPLTIQFGSLPAIASRGDQQQASWYLSEQKCKDSISQISKYIAEKLETDQLSLTGWLTPCNQMSYEMSE
jgi:hypothetical protein